MYAEDIDAGTDSSPSTAMLSEVARTLKITIVGGSIPERCGDKLYNTCCVFGTDGKLKAKHRKVLFFMQPIHIAKFNYIIVPNLQKLFAILNSIYGQTSEKLCDMTA